MGGHGEGKFALKSKKRNPATGTWFEPQDFVVGTIVEINSTPFELLRADECTLKYMEDNCWEFPVADANLIASKLQGLRDELTQTDYISTETLAQLADARGLDLL